MYSEYKAKQLSMRRVCTSAPGVLLLIKEKFQVCTGVFFLPEHSASKRRGGRGAVGGERKGLAEGSSQPEVTPGVDSTPERRQRRGWRSSIQLEINKPQKEKESRKKRERGCWQAVTPRSWRCFKILHHHFPRSKGIDKIYLQPPLSRGEELYKGQPQLLQRALSSLLPFEITTAWMILWEEKGGDTESTQITQKIKKDTKNADENERRTPALPCCLPTDSSLP